jgi:DNA invertase Pin-like site-specific DNA recombinase
MAKLVGYARVAKDEQNTNAQRAALKAAGCEIIYKERASISDRQRPEFARALAAIRAGDTLVVTRLDRVAWSIGHLLELIGQLRGKGAAFRALGDPIDTSTPQGEFALQVLAAVAEFERKVIASRTREGIKAAMARGAKPGNPGVRRGDKRAIALIQRRRRDTHLSKLLSNVDDWLPTVRKMRPSSTWKDVMGALNGAEDRGGPWTVERLIRAVRLLVNEHLAERTLLNRAPRRPVNPALAQTILRIRLANPSMSLRQVAKQLEHMKIRSPRGLRHWSASMVSSLLRPPLTTR